MTTVLTIVAGWGFLIALLLIALRASKKAEEATHHPAPVVDLTDFLESRERRINAAKFRRIKREAEKL